MGAFIAGPLSDVVGVRNASMILGSVAIATIALLYLLSPVLRELRHQ
jgi:MFS family permease